jgi:hypothetical protein
MALRGYLQTGVTVIKSNIALKTTEATDKTVGTSIFILAGTLSGTRKGYYRVCTKSSYLPGMYSGSHTSDGSGSQIPC